MALRPLRNCRMSARVTTLGTEGATVPLGGLSHALHKSVERLLATLFKRLRDGL
jgi:hypothetical protein